MHGRARTRRGVCCSINCSLLEDGELVLQSAIAGCWVLGELTHTGASDV